jgi:hypothetical protein
MSDTGGGNISKLTVGGTDIKGIFYMLEYFESINSPTISANITLNDASGTEMKVGDDVEISFGDRANGSGINVKMKSLIVGDRVRVKENQDMFLMTCASSEFADNNKKAVSKAYKDKKISDMVKDWHEEYTKESTTLKKSLVDNEETEGNAAYHGTGKGPISAIRWGAKEAKSAKAKASNYVYYQDREGYYFKTLDAMLAAGGSPVELSYSSQNIGDAGGADDSKKIIAFDQKKDFDKMEASYNGAESDHWYYYDPTVGKIDSPPKGKRDGAGDTTHTGSDKITKDSKSAIGERFNFVVAPGQAKSKFRDSRDPKISENKRNIAEHAAQSSAANQLDNMIMTIRVPGNTSYKPGSKVKLNIPGNSEGRELDKRSGTYLVTQVRHVIYKDDKDLKYEVIMECKSDSKNKSSSSGNSGVAK